VTRFNQVKGRIAAMVFAVLLGGCATGGTGGGGVYYSGAHYDDFWYGYGYGAVCCVDNPGDIGSGPRPEHPIAIPPGSAPRPEHPIAMPPTAEPKASVSATTSARASTTNRSGSIGGGGFGGGGRGGGRR